MGRHDWRGDLRQFVLRRRPSPALIVACVALVVALGGASYAAFRLPAGAVGPLQLRDHAVTSAKLARGAVVNPSIAARAIGGRNIADAAVTSSKLAKGAVAAAHIQNGAVTAQKLAPGAITSTAVPAGAGVRVTYRYGSVVVQPGQGSSAFVACPPRTTVVGGGATSEQPSVRIDDSAPFNSAADAWTGGVSDSWGVYATNTDSAQSHTLAIYAVCLATAP